MNTCLAAKTSHRPKIGRCGIKNDIKVLENGGYIHLDIQFLIGNLKYNDIS